MLKQLSGVDASFLYMETPSSFGHVNGLSVYSRPYPEYEPYEAFRAQLEPRIAELDPFRRRLVNVPFGLDHPYWIDDPDFDLDFHLRHMALPAPGDDEQLALQVARIIGRPMDRSRPLWEVYVVDGLHGGDFAVLTKLHHATIDGASGAELLTMLLDTSPDTAPPERASTVWRGDHPPPATELVARAMINFIKRPQRLASLQVRTLREFASATRNVGLSALIDTLLARRPATRELSGEADERDRPPLAPAIMAPRTPFNRPITPHRRFAFASVPLDDVKAIKNAVGVTLNDVVMAVCAGALRRYLLHHDALPDRRLVSGIPVSIRTGDEVDKWTNRVSMIFADLPTDLDDPLARVAAVHDVMIAAKQRFDLIPADAIVDLAEQVPAALATRAIRLAGRLRITDRLNPPVNLIISNVPGPRHPLYLAGAQLLHYYPVSTVVDGQGLNITVQSYMNWLDFGLVSCRELVPDLWDLLDMCLDEIEVLKEACGLPATPGAARVVPAATAPADAAPTQSNATTAPAKKSTATKTTAAKKTATKKTATTKTATTKTTPTEPTPTP
jgi:WS/DGAT/MGAT family acyltransferase